MRTVYFTLIFILSIPLGNAQIYEVGVFGGGSNVIGDVGSTTFVAPKKVAFGGIVRWNRSPRHSYRASVVYTTLFGNDYGSSDPKRKARGYNFNAQSLEISAGMEFTFLDFDLLRRSFNFSPYIYTGVSMLNHPNFYYNGNRLISEKTRSNAYGIPIALGLKATLTEHLIFGIEIGARYTFSDELDGNVPDTKELKRFRFGNLNNTDWYVFSGFTLTYTFGINPCFCDY